MQVEAAPKSAMRGVIHYLLKQWPYLIRYLEYEQLEVSANRAEHNIKSFIMSRKNWLFINTNTPAGTQLSIPPAQFHSFIEPAKENGLDLYRYLLWFQKSALVLGQNPG